MRSQSSFLHYTILCLCVFASCTCLAKPQHPTVEVTVINHLALLTPNVKSILVFNNPKRLDFTLSDLGLLSKGSFHPVKFTVKCRTAYVVISILTPWDCA